MGPQCLVNKKSVLAMHRLNAERILDPSYAVVKSGKQEVAWGQRSLLASGLELFQQFNLGKLEFR